MLPTLSASHHRTREARPEPLCLRFDHQGQAKPSPFGQPPNLPAGFLSPTRQLRTPLPLGTQGLAKDEQSFREETSPGEKSLCFESTAAAAQWSLCSAAQREQPIRAKTRQTMPAPLPSRQHATQAPHRARQMGPFEKSVPADSARQHPPIESLQRQGHGRPPHHVSRQTRHLQAANPASASSTARWQRIFFAAGHRLSTRTRRWHRASMMSQARARWAAFAEDWDVCRRLMPDLPPPRDCTMWNF